MKTYLYTLLSLTTFAFIPNAFAGDAATMIFRSGAVVYVENGFKQLSDGMQAFRKQGSDNYPIEVNIEGTTFFVNLGEIALLCRDKCSSLEITRPSKHAEGRGRE